jgi:drug/metabolite transporter (DMT)-like permease
MSNPATMAMSRRDWIILLTLGVLWGGSFFFIEIAVDSVPPLTLVLIRVTLAALALWIFLFATGQRGALPARTWPAFLLLALLNNALPFGLFAWAQAEIAGGLASILNATTPIWGVIVAHLCTRDERMTPGKLAGVLIGFVGVATMIGGDLLKDVGSAVLPQLACLGATLAYALAGVFGRHFHRMGLTPVMVSTGQLSAAVFIMLPLVLLFEPP